MSSAAYKAANYDTNITVDQSQIDALKSRGTPESNFEHYKKNGASAVEVEALNRFYGKDKVAAAGISASGLGGTPDSPNNRENRVVPDTNRVNAIEDRVPRTPTPAITPSFRGGQTWPTAPVDRAQDPARVPTPGFRGSNPNPVRKPGGVAPTTQPVRDSAPNPLVTTTRAPTTQPVRDSKR